MSAETLRRAAALMRERAEAVSTEHRAVQTLARGVVRCSCGASSVGNPYWAKEHGSEPSAWQVSDDDATQIWDERQRLVTSAEGLDEALHIASWHPAVALAVAQLLDDIAETRELLANDVIPASAWNITWATAERRALAVARAYLGSADA